MMKAACLALLPMAAAATSCGTESAVFERMKERFFEEAGSYYENYVPQKGSEIKNRN